MRLLEHTDAFSLQSLLPKLKYAEKTDPDAKVCCADCLQTITSHQARIEIQGSNEHLYTNPHGFRFHIICYRDAPGCLSEGTSTSLHTWFAGYEWRYALCGNCRGHLGWHYNAAGGDYFYGLIKDRLIEKHGTN